MKREFDVAHHESPTAYSCAFPARGDLKEIFYNLTGGHESEDRKKIKGNQVIYSTSKMKKGL